MVWAAGAGPLRGREPEIALLTSLIDGVSSKGAALVLRGEPGIGKSRLLREAIALAADRNMTVVATSGVQAEARIPFAGLHQLLRPVRDRAMNLMPEQRLALDAAFGLDVGAQPAQFRIALGTLDLLCEIAAASPLLVVVEDAHWVDQATAEVLAFVARRLEADPIVLLVATRDGYDSPLTEAGLPEHRLAALDSVASRAVLDAISPRLSISLRDTVLRQAAGNPLALTELPLTAGREHGRPRPGALLLTERLEHAFTARLEDLPEETRLLLLIAALNDRDNTGEILQATAFAADQRIELEALEPAARAGLVELDVSYIRFRHPLMRSAVRQATPIERRRRAHEALAKALSDEPDRRVWHRAALISGTHEDIAAELEETGRRARRRGAVSVAATALRRAAELSASSQRARRLVAASELAFELGQLNIAAPLLRELELLAPGPLERARAAWIDEMMSLRAPSPMWATKLIALAEDARAADDHDLHFALLWLVATRFWWADPGLAAQHALIDAATRLGNADDLRVLAIHAYADPFGHASAILARVEKAVQEDETDSDALLYLGPAAVAIGAFDVASTLLVAATRGLRGDGRLGHLAYVLAIQGLVAARLTDWDVAIPAAGEAKSLADELGQPLWKAGADMVNSTIAGMRGDAAAAEEAAAEAERVAASVGANVIVALAQCGRISAALGASRHHDAYETAMRLFDPSDSAYHAVIATWIIADLAEAATHLDRIDEARACVAQVEARVGSKPAAWIALNLRHARAVLADDDQADSRFQQVLGADLRRWPFQRARALLAYGQWLRRQRRITESRAPLREARDAFDALGCDAFGDQARRELRASGESSRRRDPAARDQLTAQELQIAHLAAQGMSNREIGQQLYVSHRTVATHLYRIYPKLGIAARNQLSTALASA